MNGISGGGGGGKAASSSSSSTSLGGTGVSSIPTASRKIVQNLKEIVNCTELEIYAVLKECNMDPSETISRLLDQDTFQEVKSKRDKKKEVKDTLEPKVRTVNNATNRGGRVGNDRTPHLGSNNLISNDYGAIRNKILLKNDNVLTTGPGSSILGCATTGNAFHRMPGSLSGVASPDTSVQLVSSTDHTSLLSKPVGVQHAWSVRPGQVSMADIVRMGRPQGKLSCNFDIPSEVTSTMCSANLANDFQFNANHSTSTILPSESIEEWSSQNLVSNEQENIHNPVTSTTDEPLHHDSRPLHNHFSIENNKMSLTSISSDNLIKVKPSGASSLYHDDISRSSYGDGVESTFTYHVESHETKPETSGVKEVDHSRNQLTLDSVSVENTSFYDSKKQTSDPFEVKGIESEVPSITSNFQYLTIQNESHGRASEDRTPAVIFPEYLQVTSAECSHLSFGSFKSVTDTGNSRSNAQEVVNCLPDQTPTTSDATSFHHIDPRNIEFYTIKQSNPIFTENVASRANEDAEDYNQPPSSQITGLQTGLGHSPHEIQYNCPTIPHARVFSSTTQSTVPEKNYVNTDPTPNISSLSSVMQAYASSRQNNFLASNTHPVRELDASYLSLLASQSMPAKYATGMPSINQPTISLAETLKSSFLSASQATQQKLAPQESSNIAAGASVPLHLPVHPYSQPALPLGQVANIMGYPFLTPNYTYLSSASFPPTYTDNTAFHQTRSAAQSAGAKYAPSVYRNNISLSSLAQNAAVPSGYGGIGISDNNSGNYVVNPPSASANTGTSFSDILASQYKQGNPYASLQQSEMSNMWLQSQGGVSRSVSALPANTYYSLQGQSQHSGFGQQIQQQPSHYGATGYQNFYHTQVGLPQERQSDSSEVANSNSSHSLPSQSSHHLWQNNY